MAALKLGLFLSLLLHALCFLPHEVHCGDEDDLLAGFNSYRTSLHVPTLSKNKKADCLAEKIADHLENRKCNASNGVYATLASQQQYVTQQYIKKCQIDANSTTDGLVMTVCVHKLVPTLVLANFTYTKYAKYVRSTNYTGAGLGCADDWMVVVLTTNTTAGSFTSSGANSLPLKIGLGHNVVALLVGLFVYLVY